MSPSLTLNFALLLAVLTSRWCPVANTGEDVCDDGQVGETSSMNHT